MVDSLASPSMVLGSDYQIRWEPKVKHPSVVIDLTSTPVRVFPGQYKAQAVESCPKGRTDMVSDT